MDITEKLDLFTETRVGPKGVGVPASSGTRPIQFMKWFGDFRPGDRMDVFFGEDYISIAGTNAEGYFAGVKKEMEIDDPMEVNNFIGSEGDIWNFV